MKIDPQGTQTTDKTVEAQPASEMEERESADKQIKGEAADCRGLKEGGRRADAGWSWRTDS